MSNPVFAAIEKEVKENNIVLFMKGTRSQPMCGFSSRVVQILDHLGAEYKDINVLETEELRQGIKDFSDWPTIPQLYVGAEFIGGCDIVKEMLEKGDLKKLFEDKNII